MVLLLRFEVNEFDIYVRCDGYLFTLLMASILSLVFFTSPRAVLSIFFFFPFSSQR